MDEKGSVSQVDGWMNRWMGRWAGIDRWMCWWVGGRWMDGRVSGWMDGWVCCWLDGWMDWMDRWE